MTTWFIPKYNITLKYSLKAPTSTTQVQTSSSPDVNRTSASLMKEVVQLQKQNKIMFQAVTTSKYGYCVSCNQRFTQIFHRKIASKQFILNSKTLLKNISNVSYRNLRGTKKTFRAKTNQIVLTVSKNMLNWAVNLLYKFDRDLVSVRNIWSFFFSSNCSYSF